MIIFGLPILLYLIGFMTICLASRWWALIPVSAIVFTTEWWFKDVAHGTTGFMADTAATMLLLTVIGTIAGFVTRVTLLTTGWSALQGRGLALTLVVFVMGPVAYALTASGL